MMQDLIQDYASDLKKLREMFHNELTATADELSKAMSVYAQRSEAALASFMEKASARGLELEVSASARLSQFCGAPANGRQAEADDKPLTRSPNADVFKIAAIAGDAAVHDLQVDSQRNHQPQPLARSSRIVRDRPLEAVHLQLQEEQIETANSSYVTKSPVS
jgi:hypothetical protein